MSRFRLAWLVALFGTIVLVTVQTQTKSSGKRSVAPSDTLASVAELRSLLQGQYKSVTDQIGQYEAALKQLEQRRTAIDAQLGFLSNVADTTILMSKKAFQ